MRLRNSLLSAMVIAASGIAFTWTPAQALPLPVADDATVAATAGELLVEVNNHKKKRRFHSNRHWNRKHHGPRCKTRYGKCKYRYGGYYYYNPWWTLPLAGGAVIVDDGYYDGGGYDDDDDDDVGYGNRHVGWCMDRYRSYKPRYNTWVTYGGEVRRCVSPFGP